VLLPNGEDVDLDQIKAGGCKLPLIGLHTELLRMRLDERESAYGLIRLPSNRKILGMALIASSASITKTIELRAAIHMRGQSGVTCARTFITGQDALITMISPNTTGSNFLMR
jgi:hypothetical protein